MFRVETGSASTLYVLINRGRCRYKGQKKTQYINYIIIVETEIKFGGEQHFL